MGCCGPHWESFNAIDEYLHQNLDQNKDRKLMNVTSQRLRKTCYAILHVVHPLRLSQKYWLIRLIMHYVLQSPLRQFWISATASPYELLYP